MPNNDKKENVGIYKHRIYSGNSCLKYKIISRFDVVCKSSWFPCLRLVYTVFVSLFIALNTFAIDSWKSSEFHWDDIESMLMTIVIEINAKAPTAVSSILTLSIHSIWNKYVFNTIICILVVNCMYLVAILNFFNITIKHRIHST